ncbi:pentatricopeptide repeat-containing protein [Hordeum vulgare]|nr:pentatricopeptide repeat-containing protein [Hordeum vulgare]
MTDRAPPPPPVLQHVIALQNTSMCAYNALIRAYSWRGPAHAAGALALYAAMLRDGRSPPNKYTFPFVLKACSALLDLRAGRVNHRLAARAGLHADLFVSTAFIDLYMKCARFRPPNAVFHAMPARDAVASNVMVAGYALHGIARSAPVHAYSVRASLHDKDGVLVGTALLDMYAKCGNLLYALRVFEAMAIRNDVTWSAIIGGFVVCGRMLEAFILFKDMLAQGLGFLSPTSVASSLRACASLADVRIGKQLHVLLAKSGLQSDLTAGNSLLSMYAKNGMANAAFLVFGKMQVCNVELDVGTMVSLIPACAHLAALQHGKCSHGSVIVRGMAPETSICNALIDMYAKCGRIAFSRQIFDAMSSRDIVSWNTMIAGYGIHGLGKEVTALFLDMKNHACEPDGVTFICLISTCSHSGLMTEGKRWFHMMAQKYDVRVWGALLAACRVHKNIDLGKQVARVIQKLGPEGTGNFVLLSNIFSAAGRFDAAAEVRIIQKEKGFKKSPGCSWIEINGSLHAFIGGDRSHPRSPEIHQELHNILVDINKLGYQADTSFVLQDLEEEEKEKALLYHSEKLAIAFGILTLSEDKDIFVTKNLRVCGDCHTVIKYMSLVRRRDIIVRDANMFHHFKNGQCSCGDFW